MAKYKVVMLVDASMTYEKVMAEDAQRVLKRLEGYGAELVYVEAQKGWDRGQFVEYASQVEKMGPEPFPVNEDLLREAADADIILVNFAPVGSKVIEAAKKLKMIGVTRSGAENVNLEAAAKAGVKVAVAPGRLAEPVSDYTVGLILAESRNIARMSITDHGGAWMNDCPNASYIKSLRGCVVGLVGYGIIGQRVAAKLVLSRLLVRDLRENPAVPYEDDEVTRLNQDSIDPAVYGEIAGWSMAELREYILDGSTTEQDIRRLSRGLTSEVVAGVCKLMGNLDLVYAAGKVRVTATCNTTIGRRGTLATRLQPNHAADSVEGITASLFEGLSYGCGDALLGLNPVSDTVSRLTEVLKRFDEVKRRFEIPTQICVLGHITTQIEAVRAGAPADMIFQSIAGSQKGNLAFGFSAATVREALAVLKDRGAAKGPDVLYFETGQGSELSSDAHYGTDQVTMEARCYGFAREFHPFMVNTVVGFIGPEYLYDSRQVIRAGLEDHFMGKLTGIPMGCDCCYTNHMLADQNDIENLALLLGGAGVNYILGVPAGDDVMLNYQTNAYHDVNAIREVLGLRPIPEFEAWLEKMGLMENGRLTGRAGDPTIFAKGR